MLPITINQFRNKYFWGGVFLLWLMAALALTSLSHQSPTFDEQGFITRGLGYVRGENRHMRVGHPAGLNAFSALFLAADDTVHLPTNDTSWQLNGFHRPSELFMWEMGNDVARVMFLARLPILWLGMLLAAVVGRWAWQMSRLSSVGLIALALIALDPNILAHSTLATTDLGLTAAVGFAGYTLWLLLKRPLLSHAILAGIAFGLLQNTKFTAGLFVPLFALVILIHFSFWLWDAWQQRHQSPISNLLKPFILVIIAYAVIAPLALWATYGFQIGTLPPDLPVFSQWGGLTVPLSHHLEQLLDIGGRLEKTTPAYLLGQYSDHGWWYYFPVAFVLKTPLPTLILLVLAFLVRIGTYVTHKREPHASRLTPHALRTAFLDDATLLIPAFGYFAFALTTDINLGYRHLLPILPFLAVFSANSLSPLLHSTRRTTRYLIPALLAALLLISLWIYPHYLSYFNVLAGGPDNGWRALVDSNIDWGQDLGGLKEWLDEHDVDQVWLSYFGEGRPEYYGINYIGLDSWPPRLMNPEARPFYPHDPAPGMYAISATTLQGVQFADHDRFAWFRDKEPLAKIGYSIFVYDVPAYGEPVDLVLSGVQLDEITPDDFARFGTNEIMPHWIDLTEGFLWPERSPYWLAVSKDEVVHFFFGEWIANEEKVSETEEYFLYRVGFEYSEQENPQNFSQNDHQIDLMSFSIPDESLNDSLLMIITRWQNQSLPAPIKLFIHLTDSKGNIQAQWDGLSTPWEGFRQGDTLIQIHYFEIPYNLPPGSYQVRAGLYHPETGERWTLPDGADEIVLREITLK